MLFKLRLTAYLIGNMMNLVVHWSGNTRDFVSYLIDSNHFLKVVNSTSETNFLMYTDKVTAASEFAKRNHLPAQIRDQILSHICFDYKTRWLKQQDTLNCLPKAIRASISRHLTRLCKTSICFVAFPMKAFSSWSPKWKQSIFHQRKS
ncbi:putative cyclic nucleotide-binding protein [Helianthus annuus]|nr:putative cyclic nucleotide-binding protein [Helianthus annuus]